MCCWARMPNLQTNIKRWMMNIFKNFSDYTKNDMNTLIRFVWWFIVILALCIAVVCHIGML